MSKNSSRRSGEVEQSPKSAASLSQLDQKARAPHSHKLPTTAEELESAIAAVDSDALANSIASGNTRPDRVSQTSKSGSSPHSKTTKPPTYKRMKRKGQADSACCYFNGKRVLLGVYGSTESHEKFAEVVNRHGVSPNDDTSEPTSSSDALDEVSANPTVNEVLVAYLEFAQTYYVQHDGKTSREYGSMVEVSKLLRFEVGEELAEDFGPKKLKALRELLVAEGWTRKFINNQVDRIRRIFKWAAADELIPASVPQSLSMVPGLRKGRSKAKDSKVIRPVDDATVEATLEHLPQVVADMARLQRLTGCRPGEMTILRPCDIDWSGEIWFYTPKRHKTQHIGHSRTIAIGPKAQDVLRRYLARDAKMYCFRPCDSEEKRRAARHAKRVTPMNCGNVPSGRKRGGDHYSVDSYRRAITRACEKAGVDPWTPHRLRHTAATEVRKEFGLDAAQCVLGHKSASITQVYAELDRAKAAAVAAKIG